MRMGIAAMLALALLTASSRAETMVRVAGGLLVEIDSDGKLSFRSLGILPLEDGRVIKRTDDKWVIDPPDAGGVETVKPIDLSVFGENMVGKRVRLTARIFGVDAGSGILSLPGGAAYLNLQAVPGDVLKRLIEVCGSIVAPPSDRCMVTVTGTVMPETSRGKVHLSNLLIASSDQGKTRTR